jgi:hypothetical protein
MQKYRLQLIIILVLSISFWSAQNTEPQSAYSMALLKYNGGGDWYANPTSLPNLAAFCNENLGTKFRADIPTVSPDAKELFSYPFVHMTGHGNVIFSMAEVDNLRSYLIAGGFLHISDNYGMDQYIRREMKKVFPELDFIELPTTHPIYHQKYQFPNGLPKIHEHDGKPAQGFGLIYQGRLVCFYDYECDLGDGWEDPEVHNDSQKKRTEALQMGANMIQLAFLGEG